MKTRFNHQGITMTEVLLTMVILGVGVIALLKLQAYMIGFNMVAQQQSEAILLSNEKIEKFRDYQQLVVQNGVKAYADIVNGSETLTRANTTYTLSWTVTTSNNPQQKQINTVVSWTDHQNKQQTMRLSSMIGANEPKKQGNVVDGAGAGSILPS